MTEVSKPTEALASSATETLSQLLARILNQLSLSSWLPSAALTLSLAIVLQIGAVLDTPHAAGAPRTSGAGVLSAALGRLADVGASGLLLLGTTVVVLTMLTQAFTFEAIRTLEGFWGTNRVGDHLAGMRCKRHRKKWSRLRNRLRSVMEDVWASAAAGIAADDQQRIDRGQRAQYTANMINALGAQYLGKATKARLTQAQKDVVVTTSVEEYAPADLLRRMTNLNKRLADYPQDEARVQPTMLGNVLRRHEDDSHEDDPDHRDVEMLVEEVFDKLPVSLQIAHDEQRGRLDLYCSMVVVWLFVVAVAALRLGSDHRGWAVGVIAASVVGSYFSYRAAIASARYYGRLFVLIAQRAERLEST